MTITGIKNGKVDFDLDGRACYANIGLSCVDRKTLFVSTVWFKDTCLVQPQLTDEQRLMILAAC